MLHLPSAIFYASMSIFMVFSNKYIISTWGFNNPIVLILLEMFLNILIVHFIDYYRNRRSRSSHNNKHVLVAYNNHDHYHGHSSRHHHGGSFAKPLTLGLHLDAYTKYQYMIVVFYCFHSVLSLKALSGLNIPMYVMFKRCVPLANLIISIFVFKNVDLRDKHTQKIVGSILAMTFGVVIAGIGDIDFNMAAYLYCGASVLAQAGYLSSIQKHGESTSQKASMTSSSATLATETLTTTTTTTTMTTSAEKSSSGDSVSSLQSLYDCSLMSIPILVVIFLISEEPTNVYIQFYSFSSNDFLVFLVVLFVNILFGSLLCFSQFWCTLNNNAITTSVLGVLKSMLQTVLGILLFQGWLGVSDLTYVGIAINFTFGIYYTYLKHSERDLLKH